MVNRVVTDKTFTHTLMYGSRTVNQMDSPYQTVDNLIGIDYKGESLLSVPRNFPGINMIQVLSNKKIDRKKKENLRINNRMLYESTWINNRSF